MRPVKKPAKTKETTKDINATNVKYTEISTDKWKKACLVLAVLSLLLFIIILAIHNSNALLIEETIEQKNKIGQLDSVIQEMESMQHNKAEKQHTSISLTINDIKSIPNSEGVQSFNIIEENGSHLVETNSGVAPTIKTDFLLDINKYLDQINNQQHTAGFLFIDLQTSKGISYNLDYQQYSASTIKAPYCIALCQNLIDSGQASMNDYIGDYDDNFCSNGSISVKEAINNTIRDSSNGSYRALRLAYLSRSNFAGWLNDVGISDTYRFLSSIDDYANFSPREGAQMWLQIYKYFMSDASCSTFIQDNFANTRVSFIRNACAADQNLKSAVVWNKAGWISEGNDYNTLSDFGVLRIDGKDYLCIFATNLPDLGEQSSNVLEHLISSVIHCRGHLK
ncbi:MAG: serine hydrolase [Eggerthellaceae bacterium]|nr:serine hydrolase [Eggerthellaceae bacterium]